MRLQARSKELYLLNPAENQVFWMIIFWTFTSKCTALGALHLLTAPWPALLTAAASSAWDTPFMPASITGCRMPRSSVSRVESAMAL